MGYERLITARRLIADRKYREAVVELQAILNDNERPSQTEEAKELLALAYFKGASLPLAESVARELVADKPTNTYAHTLLVRSLERQSKKQEAAQARNLALALGAEL